MINKSDDIENKVFTNFINIYLPTEAQIQTLEDLLEGNQLPILLESLGEKIDFWETVPIQTKGSIRFKNKMSTNIQKTYEYLNKNKVRFQNKIAPCSLKDLLGFIWDIFVSLYMNNFSKQVLVKMILQQIAKIDPDLQIKNMGNSISKGVPFIALLSKASKGTIEYVNNVDLKFNFEYIKRSCESMNIPFVLIEDCISKTAYDKCNCIQASIILKHMNAFNALPINTTSSNINPSNTTSSNVIPINETSNIQKNSNNEAEKKNFEKKVLEYEQAVHDALSKIEQVHNHIDKIKCCDSIASFEAIQSYVKQYNKDEINKCTQKMIDLWNPLQWKATKINCKIPENIITVKDVQQKVNQLDQSIAFHRSNLDSYEKTVKTLLSEVDLINSLLDARAKYQLLREQYDMDNWKQHQQDSFIYKLGNKLQYYENELKSSISQFDSNLQNFCDIHDDLYQKICQNHDDLNELDIIFDSLKNQFNLLINIHTKIIKMDPNAQNNTTKEELTASRDLIQEKLDEYKKIKTQYENDIIEYKNSTETIIKKLDKEQKEIDELTNCYSNNDIAIKKQYLCQYNNTTKDENQKYVQKIEDLLNEIKQISDQMKFEIPVNMNQLGEIKQKLVNLNQKIESQSSKIDSEEENMKQLIKHINEISSITPAMEKYNELKIQFDMDNWKQFKHDSFLYLLGDKIVNYQNELNREISNIEQSNNNYEKICNELQLQFDNKNYKDISKSIDLLDDIADSIIKSFNRIKEIDPQHQISCSPDEITLKIESFKQKFNDLIQSDFDDEVNIIIQECQMISNEMLQMEKYKNVYSSNLCQEITLKSDCSKLIIIFEVSKKPEFDQKIKEMNDLLSKTKNEYDSALKIIKNMERKCQEIESNLMKVMYKFNSFRESKLCSIISNMNEIECLIQKAKTLPIWDEKAVGSTIELYYNFVKNADQFIKDKQNIIDTMVISYLNSEKKANDELKQKYMIEIQPEKITQLSQIVSKEVYEYVITELTNKITQIKVLSEINDKYELNRKTEIVEYSNELNIMKETCEKLLEDYLNKIYEIYNNIIQKINTIAQNEMDKIEKEIDDDKGKKLTEQYIDSRGSDMIHVYEEILSYKETIKQLIKQFLLNVNDSDIDNYNISFIFNSIIAYKSTLLFDPECYSDNIIQRIDKCQDSEFSLYMVVLYIYKFDKNDIFVIPNMPKSLISNLIIIDEPFMFKLSQKICQMIESNDPKQSIKLQLLESLLDYLPNFESYFKYYLDVRINYSSLSSIDKKSEITQKISNITNNITEKRKYYEGHERITIDPNFKCETIVIHFDNNETQIGYAGSYLPKHNFKNNCGYTVDCSKDRLLNRYHCFRSEFVICSEPRNDVRLIEQKDTKGNINWEFLEKFLQTAMLKFDIPYSIVFINSNELYSSRDNYQKIVDILFNEIGVSRVCCIDQNTSVILNTGKVSGLVVNIGEYETIFCPVYNRQSFDSNQLDIGGNDIKQLLKNEKCYNFENAKCYVAYDYEYEKNQLRDGKRINCTEVLLQPSLNCHEFKGIPEKIVEIIDQCDIECQKEIYSNIVLIGKYSSLPGLVSRIEKEINIKKNFQIQVNVTTIPLPQYAIWQGGSVLGCSSLFNDLWYSCNDYRLNIPYEFIRKLNQ